MTPHYCAQRAAAALAAAQERLTRDAVRADSEAAHALVAIADSWRYLLEALDDHPRATEP